MLKHTLRAGGPAANEKKSDAGAGHDQSARVGNGVGDGQCWPVGDGGVFAAVDDLGGFWDALIADEFPAEIA